MIDLSDIENAFVASLGQKLTGSASVGNPPAARPNIVGVKDARGQTVEIRIKRGFPVSSAIDEDMAAGRVVIIVGPEQGMTRILKPLRSPPVVTHTVPITMSVEVTDPTVAINGLGTAGQVVGIGVGNTGYAYRCVGGETASAVAQNLASQINGAQVSQNQIYVPGGHKLIAGVVSDSFTSVEVARQVQAFRIAIYAPTPALRDAIGRLIAPTLMQVRRFELEYGVTNAPKYLNVWTDDTTAKVDIFKRVERWEVEYPTNAVEQVPGVLFAGLNSSGKLVGQFHPDGPITIERIINV